MAFLDDFDGSALDRDAWLPHYLPHWSSRAASAATYAVADSELRLTIPSVQGLWCEGDHEPPLRVSGVQSGAHDGQQPFRDAQEVRERGSSWSPCSTSPRSPARRTTCRCSRSTAYASTKAWIQADGASPARRGSRRPGARGPRGGRA